MNNLTSIFLSHPKEFMRLINRLRRLSLQSEISDDEEFMKVMLEHSREQVSPKTEAYQAYVTYDYLDYDMGKYSEAFGGSILHLNNYPKSFKGITEIHEKLKNFKSVVIRNIILLED